MTTDEERVPGGGLNGDQAVQISRLSSGKSFVGKTERESSLYSMHSLISSQCRDLRIGVT